MTRYVCHLRGLCHSPEACLIEMAAEVGLARSRVPGVTTSVNPRRSRASSSSSHIHFAYLIDISMGI
jgi:hypothetical protein